MKIIFICPKCENEQTSVIKSLREKVFCENCDKRLKLSEIGAKNIKLMIEKEAK